jgi:hypothetical protein
VCVLHQESPTQLAPLSLARKAAINLKRSILAWVVSYDHRAVNSFDLGSHMAFVFPDADGTVKSLPESVNRTFQSTPLEASDDGGPLQQWLLGSPSPNQANEILAEIKDPEVSTLLQPEGLSFMKSHDQMASSRRPGLSALCCFRPFHTILRT